MGETLSYNFFCPELMITWSLWESLPYIGQNSTFFAYLIRSGAHVCSWSGHVKQFDMR